MFKSNWADSIYTQISLGIVGVFALLIFIYQIIKIKNSHRGSLKEVKFEIICVTTAEKQGSLTTSRGKGLVDQDSTETSLPRIVSGVPENITLKEGDFILCFQPEKEVMPSTFVEPFRCWYAEKLDKDLVNELLKSTNLKFGIIKESSAC